MKTRLSLILLSLAIVFFFSPLLSLNFNQDDFFHLLISRAHSLKNYLYIFSFKNSFTDTNYDFYRPFAVQFFYSVMQNFFGLQPFFYHLASLVLHLINTLLVFYIARLFFPNEKKLLALSAAFFYGLSQCLFSSVGWIGNFQEVSLAFFAFLTLILFYKNQALLSFITFALSLACKETAAAVPFALLAFTFFYNRTKKGLLKLVPSFILLSIYLYYYFVIYGDVPRGDYQFKIGPGALNNLMWYVFWALGLPEMFLDYIGPHLTILPSLWKMFFKEALVIFSLFILLISCLLYSLKNSKPFKKPVLFFLSFYLIFLLPVLFLKSHKFPSHETTALLGFSIILAYLSRKRVLGLIALVFLLLSFSSSRLALKTHWMVGRAKVVDAVLVPFLKQYPVIPKSTVIYIKNDPHYPKINDAWGGTAKQAWVALSGENAFKVYYKDDSIKVYYEGVTPIPSKVETPKFIEFPAIIPY